MATTSSVGINSVGRYALSLILSHLSECEGVSLLIISKRFAWHVLPVFRLPRGLLIVNVASSGAKHRHQFIAYPAQDPEMLLERLNTRRLRKRLTRRRPGNESCLCYGWNKTTRQLAVSEQQKCQRHPADEELLRFLSPSDNNTTTTNASTAAALLVSYPRSGNTLLRNLLERLTGIVTGSDNRPDRKLSRDLAVAHNLVGEGVVNFKRVQIIKTHYPERQGARICASKAILLVRNPYDAIDSYWNLNLTNTHTETVTDDIYAQFHETFKDLAANEMKVWLRFHRYWLKKAPIPVLVVRFEDLIGNMEHELMRIASFLQLPTSRISHACGRGDNPSQVGSYRPRTTGKKPYGKSLEKGRYSDDLIQKFHDMANDECVSSSSKDQSLLQYFGYDILVQDFPNNFLSGSVPPVVDAEQLLSKGAAGATESSVGAIMMEINEGYQLRLPADKYGRSMKQWRLDRTNNDREPFPIVQR